VKDKETKDTTTKIKWGIYIEKDIMDKVKKDAKGDDRSINYIIEKILKEHYDR